MPMRVSELPPSMTATFAVLATFAFVLTQAAETVGGKRAATKHIDELKTKAQRVVSEMQRFQAERDELLSWLSTHHSSPSGSAMPGLADEVEGTGERIDRARDAIRRVILSMDMFERVLVASGPHSRVLERLPAWHEAAANVRGAIHRLRSDLQRTEFERMMSASNEMVEEMLLRTLAETGLKEWADNLPPEDDSLFDTSGEHPVHWDRDLGWVEGAF
jgi:hypothetical protein